MTLRGMSESREPMKRREIMSGSYLVASAFVGLTISWPTALVATDLPSGPLDGMIFVALLGPDGKSKDTPDTLVFENGTFVSKECELRCKYPARPYFSRSIGGKTEFVSETQCPYKDAKIVWRGTIEGDTIKGESIWVVKRWYRTVQDTFEFEGTLTDKSTLTSGAQ